MWLATAAMILRSSAPSLRRASYSLPWERVPRRLPRTGNLLNSSCQQPKFLIEPSTLCHAPRMRGHPARRGLPRRLRASRNTELPAGACHRARRWRDPVAGNLARWCCDVRVTASRRIPSAFYRSPAEGVGKRRHAGIAEIGGELLDRDVAVVQSTIVRSPPRIGRAGPQLLKLSYVSKTAATASLRVPTHAPAFESRRPRDGGWVADRCCIDEVADFFFFC